MAGTGTGSRACAASANRCLIRSEIPSRSPLAPSRCRRAVLDIRRNRIRSMLCTLPTLALGRRLDVGPKARVALRPWVETIRCGGDAPGGWYTVVVVGHDRRRAIAHPILPKMLPTRVFAVSSATCDVLAILATTPSGRGGPGSDSRPPCAGARKTRVPDTRLGRFAHATYARTLTQGQGQVPTRLFLALMHPVSSSELLPPQALRNNDDGLGRRKAEARRSAR
jgi:hypothetical protein